MNKKKKNTCDSCYWKDIHSPAKEYRCSHCFGFRNYVPKKIITNEKN